VHAGAVLAASSPPEGLAFPAAPWHERLLGEDDASWFSRLSLAKSSA